MIITCPSCQARFNVDEDKLGLAGRRVRCSKCGNAWHQTAHEPEDAPEIEPAVEIEADEARALFGMIDNGRAEDAEPPESLFEKLSGPPPEPETEPELEPDLVPEPEPEREAEPEPEPEPAPKPEAEPVQRAAPQDPAPDETPPPPPKQEDQWTGKAPAFAKPTPARRPLAGAAAVLIVALAALAVVQGRAWIVERVPATERLYQRVGLGEVLGSDLVVGEVTSERRLVDGVDSLVIEGTIANRGARARAVPPLELRFADGTRHEAAIEVAAAELAPGAETRFEAVLATPPENDELSLRFFAPR